LTVIISISAAGWSYKVDYSCSAGNFHFKPKAWSHLSSAHDRSWDGDDLMRFFHPSEFPSNHMPAVTLGNSMVYYEAEELNPARRIKPLECPAFIRGSWEGYRPFRMEWESYGRMRSLGNYPSEATEESLADNFLDDFSLLISCRRKLRGSTQHHKTQFTQRCWEGYSLLRRIDRLEFVRFLGTNDPQNSMTVERIIPLQLIFLPIKLQE